MTHICKERLLERSLLSHSPCLVEFIFPVLKVIDIHKHTKRAHEVAMSVEFALTSHLIPVQISVSGKVSHKLYRMRSTF